MKILKLNISSNIYCNKISSKKYKSENIRLKKKHLQWYNYAHECKLSKNLYSIVSCGSKNCASFRRMFNSHKNNYVNIYIFLNFNYILNKLLNLTIKKKTKPTSIICTIKNLFSFKYKFTLQYFLNQW